MSGPTGDAGAEPRGITGPADPESERLSTTWITQGVQVASVSEPKSLITAREIENWCRRCRDFKMPVFSEENWSGVLLGISAGLLVALWAGDFEEHPGREDAMFMMAGFSAFLALVFGTLALSRRRKTDHDLGKLATEMEGACKANQARELPATPVEQAADMSGSHPYGT